MDSTITSEVLPVRVSRAVQRLGLSLLSPSGDLIDWREVSGIAIDVVGERWDDAAVPSEVSEEFAALVRRVMPAIGEFTGLEPRSPLSDPVVFNRSEWIVTTSQTIKPLIEPFLEQLVGSGRLGERRFLKTALSGELGVVIGYLARRVLGQYDVSLLDPQAGDGRLYFIYPNILETERRLGVEGEEFRLWLALHEVTHAFEFQANPWLRGYMGDLIGEQLAYLKAHTQGDQTRALLVPGAWRELMSVEENPILAKTQALMSVLEGYSEFVMERAGAAVGAEQNIAEMFDHARRSKNLVNKLFERLIGLQVKIDQYRLGYQFIQHVAGATDMGLTNRLWEGPSNLPTLTELVHPELWINRMLK